ncbi:progestin and adipoQ receptor family member 3a isoform X4 [Gadus morhua]|uniref:progestin and adipoQ receptor family member 3a isoform X4 n=1 Tax=Gadus morhua TaxID=8049 RepID=UPI0011B73D9B|nr:progestin and adipoQ receptor family member 3 isoform X4 [Gadus morhua]
MYNSFYKTPGGSQCTYTKLKAGGQAKDWKPAGGQACGPAMEEKAERTQTTHYMELGSYQYWPVLVPRGIRLYTYEQIPAFLRENPYITDGYRAYLPSRLCIKRRTSSSLFILSNETVNMWSHLLGFLLFFLLGAYNMAAVLPAIGASREDFVIYCICIFCFQYWRQVYLLAVLALMLAVFFAQIHPLYLSQPWRKLRSLIVCSLAAYGLLPTMHWVWISGGFSSEPTQLFLPRVLGMYLLAALAFLFYVSKVPERYFPGQLNYLGSSHQVWHLLLVLMFYWWHQTCNLIMAYRHSQPCPGAPQQA